MWIWKPIDNSEWILNLNLTDDKRPNLGSLILTDPEHVVQKCSFFTSSAIFTYKTIIHFSNKNTYRDCITVTLNTKEQISSYN